jgi:DNA-binding NarL/FixJ family response regulator
MTEQRLRVFLVDDHAMFRAGVRAELGPYVDVVGEASTVAEAVTRIAQLEPDVVLLDVHMPDGGGRSVLEAARKSVPKVRFLALSVSDAAEDVIGLIRAGARGYVTKTMPCSARGWPASCSTPSPRGRTRRPSTPSWTC